MEEKDEFSDILLERDSGNKASKIKKIILAVSAFLLLFIVVLVIMKYVNGAEEGDSSKIVLPPAENPLEEKQAQQDPLFKQVPIIEESDKKESFEEMVKRLKEKESKKSQEEKKDSTKNATTQTKTVQNTPSQPVEIKPINEPIKEVKVVNDKPKEPVKVTTVKTLKQEQKPVKQAKKQPVKKDVAKKPNKVGFKPSKVAIPTIPKAPSTPKSSGVKGGTYIQVLATSNLTPDKGFVKKVEAKNYNYKMHQTVVNGKKYLKILVGPYATDEKARKALVNVKKDLNPKAFLFHIK